MGKLRILFIFLFFSAPSWSSEFSLSFFPNKVVVSNPSKKYEKDKKVTLIVENEMMTRLIIQVIDHHEEIIKNISLLPKKTDSFVFNKSSNTYFIRTLQPARGLIKLNYSGEKIEIP